MSDIGYLLSGDPREKIRWRRKTDVWGDPVFGSRAMIAQLEMTDRKAKARFGLASGVEVFQGAFNSDVAASAGTHDFDRAIDCFLSGRIDLDVQLRFFRGPCEWEGWLRTPAQGFSLHFHLISSHTYDTPVGEFIPGQRADYRADPPRNGLKGHAVDPTWHPDPIPRFSYTRWKDENMPLTNDEIVAIADKSVDKLLNADLTLSDGTTVQVSTALRRAAQMAGNLNDVRDELATLIAATGKTTNTKVVNARNALMAKMDELDAQVGP